jgi:3-oxoacyl-[acyl-carrier protein] reductase
MTAQGSGSIVTLSASISGSPVPWMAALTAACGAIEFMSRSLAVEFAPAGVRVNCVRGDAMPDTRTIPLTSAGMAAIAGVPVEVFAQQLPSPPLGRPVSALDTAHTVGFLLSDASAATSAQVVNVASRAMAG